MDSKELRLGNLFQDKYTKQVIEVMELSKEKILFSGNFKGKWQAEPIPLTEEWLVKFGFENRYLSHLVLKEEYYCYCYNKVKGLYIQVFVYDEKDKVVDAEYLTPTINYVHELQNLYYALTKKELTIKK
jgi:hypothetical protein